MLLINLKIISPIATIFSGECYLIRLKTTEGEIGIAPKHQSLVAELVAGNVAIYNQNNQLVEEIAIAGGICQFTNNPNGNDEMTILAKIF